MSTSERRSAAATPQPTRVINHHRHRPASCTRTSDARATYPAHSPDTLPDVVCVLFGLPARLCGWAGGSLVEQAGGDQAEPEAEGERDGGPAEGWVEGGGKLGACQGGHVARPTGRAERRATMRQGHPSCCQATPLDLNSPRGRSLGKPHQRRARQYRATHEPSTHPHPRGHPTSQHAGSAHPARHPTSRPSSSTPAGARSPPRAPRPPSLRVLTDRQLRRRLPPRLVRPH
jgi:hypothetical protein